MSLDNIRAIKAAAKKQREKPAKKWKGMKQRSKQQAKIMRKLGNLYDPYLEKNPVCAIQSPVCTYVATCVNHKAGRGKKVVLDEETMEPSCEPCNGYIEIHDDWARENGHKVTRIYKVR